MTFRGPQAQLNQLRTSSSAARPQLQKRHEVRDHEVLEVMTEVERRARNYATLLCQGFDEQKKPRIWIARDPDKGLLVSRGRVRAVCQKA